MFQEKNFKELLDKHEDKDAKKGKNGQKKIDLDGISDKISP